MSDILSETIQVYTPKPDDVLVMHVDVSKMSTKKGNAYIKSLVELMREVIPDRRIQLIGLPMFKGKKVELEILRLNVPESTNGE